MKPKPPAADWSRAKSLLESLRAHTRLTLAAQILIGKELSLIKLKLGFVHGRNQWTRQRGESSQTWNEHCRKELGIPDRTADRWIKCFEAAVKLAKRHKKNRPEAFRLLQTPAAELAGGELDQLAECVEKIVERDPKSGDGESLTQRELMEEAGLFKNTPTSGRDKSPKGKRDESDDYYVQSLFESFTSGISDEIKHFRRTRKGVPFEARLEEMPIRSSDPDAPSLEKLKNELDHLVRDEVTPVLKEIEAAIQRKMNAAEGKALGAKLKQLS